MADNQEGNRAWWRFFDGSVSVSASMLVAVLIRDCALCYNLPIVGLLKTLSVQEDGAIVVATLVLFPAAVVFYGGAKLIFAAKQAVERETRERLRKQREEGRAEGVKEGRVEGVKEGRKQILLELREKGLLTPEAANDIENLC